MGQRVLLQTSLWNLLKLLFYSAVVYVEVSLTLVQIIWLPVLWIGVVVSVECQGRWPRRSLFRTVFAFFTICYVSFQPTPFVLFLRSDFRLFLS